VLPVVPVSARMPAHALSTMVFPVAMLLLPVVPPK